MRKHTLSALCSIFVSTALLSACGSSSGPSSTSTPAPTASAQTKQSQTKQGQVEQTAKAPAVQRATPSSSNQVAGLYDLPKAVELVKSSSHGAMVATRVFDAHIPGITGVVIAPQAALSQAVSTAPGPDGSIQTQVNWNKVPQQVAFIVNQNDSIAPQLIGKDGKVLNEDLMIELGLKKSLTDNLTEAATAAHHGFILGTKGPVITVFVDPNCIWCNKLMLDLKPHLAAGELRARIILVGFLKQDSQAKSATILASANPAKALMEDEQHFDKATESGGVKPATNPDPKLMDVVTENNNFMSQISQTGTPLTIMCNKQTHAVQMFPGMPQDLASFIAQASEEGHPACSK